MSLIYFDLSHLADGRFRSSLESSRLNIFLQLTTSQTNRVSLFTFDFKKILLAKSQLIYITKNKYYK